MMDFERRRQELASRYQVLAGELATLQQRIEATRNEMQQLIGQMNMLAEWAKSQQAAEKVSP
jgi:hypothetical protein